MPGSRTRKARQTSQGLLSIGALSAATGVPVETIRTWERRYGYPVAERTSSGHRVYPLATVGRLRRIAKAIELGHRAAQVVAASDSTLEALIAAVPGATERTSPPRARAPAVPVPPADPRDLFPAIRAFDGEQLRRSFEAEWAQLGPLDFLEIWAAPLLVAVGDAWQQGTLDVRHEHFASACLGDFLRAVRLPLDDRARGPIAALATLTGEQHGIGLEMAALVFALNGWQVVMIGVDTPMEQIAALGREGPLAVVALGFVNSATEETAGLVDSLRRALPSEVAMIVGGAGSPRRAGGNGIERMTELRSLDRWIRSHGASVASSPP